MPPKTESKQPPESAKESAEKNPKGKNKAKNDKKEVKPAKSDKSKKVFFKKFSVKTDEPALKNEPKIDNEPNGSQAAKSKSLCTAKSSASSKQVFNPLRQLLVILGSTGIFLGVALLIFGMVTPFWSVEQRTIKGVNILGRDEVKFETVLNNLSSPWKKCSEDFVNGDGKFTGKGVCRDVYVASYCDDEFFGGKCSKYRSVIVFANFGVLLGVVSFLLAAVGTLMNQYYLKNMGLASAGAGLSGFLCVIIAVSVWSSVHADMKELREMTLKAQLPVVASNSNLPNQRLQVDPANSFKSWKYELGWSFVVAILGGISMAGGSIIVGYAAYNKGRYLANTTSQYQCSAISKDQCSAQSKDKCSAPSKDQFSAPSKDQYFTQSKDQCSAPSKDQCASEINTVPSPNRFKPILLVAGAVVIFVGVTLLRFGNMDPNWTVEHSLRDPKSHKINILSSPWYYCDESKRDDGKGSCNSTYVGSFCADEDFETIYNKCGQIIAVKTFASLGVIIGAVAFLLALASTLSRRTHQQVTALGAATSGLAAGLCVFITCCIWFDVHDHIRAEGLLENRLLRSENLLYRNDPRYRKDLSYDLGYAFAMVALGGVLMSGGALLEVTGALMGGFTFSWSAAKGNKL